MAVNFRIFWTNCNGYHCLDQTVTAPSWSKALAYAESRIGVAVDLPRKPSVKGSAKTYAKKMKTYTERCIQIEDHNRRLIYGVKQINIENFHTPTKEIQ